MRRYRSVLICSLSLVFFLQTIPVSAVNKAKVAIGAGLIAGGVGLGIHAVQDVTFCGSIFPGGPAREDCDNGSEVEIGVGLALIGTGTYFLIKGLVENKKSISEKPTLPPVVVGVSPIQGGWVGGIRLSW